MGTRLSEQGQAKLLKHPTMAARKRASLLSVDGGALNDSDRAPPSFLLVRAKNAIAFCVSQFSVPALARQRSLAHIYLLSSLPLRRYSRITSGSVSHQFSAYSALLASPRGAGAFLRESALACPVRQSPPHSFFSKKSRARVKIY